MINIVIFLKPNIQNTESQGEMNNCIVEYTDRFSQIKGLSDIKFKVSDIDWAGELSLEDESSRENDDNEENEENVYKERVAKEIITISAGAREYDYKILFNRSEGSLDELKAILIDYTQNNNGYYLRYRMKVILMGADKNCIG